MYLKICKIFRFHDFMANFREMTEIFGHFWLSELRFKLLEYGRD